MINSTKFDEIDGAPGREWEFTGEGNPEIKKTVTRVKKFYHPPEKKVDLRSQEELDMGRALKREKYNLFKASKKFDSLTNSHTH